MGLASEYRRQFARRDWDTVVRALPPLAGTTVLDLGCGIGDQAALLVARGARVIGFDANEELLAAARARALPGSEFLRGDLAVLPELAQPVDGIRCSFAAAYFPDLVPVLSAWGRTLRPGGWIALTEVDGFFAHEPVGARTRARLDAYVDEALAAGRYDFRMGRRLGEHLEASGFVVQRTLELADQELAFSGAARPEVLHAWRERFERMNGLRVACGEEFPLLRADFLACLARADHRSHARVMCCLAERKCVRGEDPPGRPFGALRET